MSVRDILGSPNRKIVAVTTSKTARSKNASEFWVREYGSVEAALSAAREQHPRKRKFYYLVTTDWVSMVAVGLEEWEQSE